MLSYIFYELSRNQIIQQKLSYEIQKFIDENGKISYEAVATTNVLPYLDRVVEEALRLHTIGSHVDRVCTKPDGYSFEPVSSFKVQCGMPVLIPLYGLAHDEKYFEAPMEFNPDRENNGKIALPFGSGQRRCIGERLALIIIKTAVAKILRDFTLEVNEKTPKALTISKNSFILQYNEVLNVNFVKR